MLFRPWIKTSFKASETLLGIETFAKESQSLLPLVLGFKASETLLGIETVKL